MTNPSYWSPTSSELFFNRQDPQDLRWGAFAKSYSPEMPLSSSGQVGLWGYSDDTGIRLNGGRPGACHAPQMIRRFFYRLTPPLKGGRPAGSSSFSFSSQGKETPWHLADFGDWGPRENLQEHLDALSPLLCTQLLTQPMITLGGGHDFGAVDGHGFLQWAQKQFPQTRPLIINFDAHLDVRPWRQGLNSGTPFSWLLDHHPDQFDFIEVGIQKHCSSPHHHQWLKEKGGQIILQEEIHRWGLKTSLLQFLAGTSKGQPCFVSLDIDVFSQSLAPGCSQSWDGGLSYEEMYETLQWLYKNKNVHLLGIYEVSPPLDVDHQTSKLAACLMDGFLRHKSL